MATPQITPQVSYAVPNSQIPPEIVVAPPSEYGAAAAQELNLYAQPQHVDNVAPPTQSTTEIKVTTENPRTTIKDVTKEGDIDEKNGSYCQDNCWCEGDSCAYQPSGFGQISMLLLSMLLLGFDGKLKNWFSTVFPAMWDSDKLTNMKMGDYNSVPEKEED